MQRSEYWAGHLAAIEQEGLSTKAYAEREGLSRAALYHWRKVLKARSCLKPEKTGAGTEFVAVTLAQAPGPAVAAPAQSCVLRLPGAIVLELVSVPEPAWLIALSEGLSRRAL
jgi:transposase